MSVKLEQSRIIVNGNRLNRDREHTQEAKRRELDEVSRKLGGLIEAIAEGMRSPGLQAKLEELELRKQSIEASIGEEPPPAPRLHPNLTELYRRNERLFRGAIPDLEQSIGAPS